MPPAALEQENVSLVGYHDLDGRPGFKLAMQEADGRRYLYLAHLWHSGWTILDVTDPSNPEYVRWVAGPDNTWTTQVQVAEGRMITSLEAPLEGWQPTNGPGFHPEGDHEEGIYIWDVKDDPTDPTQVGQYETGGDGTHRNYYDGGDFAYLAARPAEYDGAVLEVVDLSTPGEPERVARWSWPGQGPDEEPDPCVSRLFDVPGRIDKHYFHGPAYVEGDRAYLSYGRLGMVTLDVAEETEPELVDRFDFGRLGSCLGTHSAVPVPDSELVAVNSEAIMEGDEDSLNYTFLVDVSDESMPSVVSAMPLPSPEPDLPYDNYYEKGGRFGPHNQHHYQHMECLWRPTELLFMTYFNAGLRVFDISDPLDPAEVGYFVPADPDERYGSFPDTLVTQFEDVLVDDRGYAYCTAKNQGLFVLDIGPATPD